MEQHLVYVVYWVLGVVASYATLVLGRTLAREYRKSLACGRFHTMRGVIDRRSDPFVFRVLVVVNALLIAMCFALPVVLAVRLILG